MLFRKANQNTSKVMVNKLSSDTKVISLLEKCAQGEKECGGKVYRQLL